MTVSDDERVKKIALAVIGKIDSVKNVRTFMYEDLQKTIGLAKTEKGAPNFMLALALCAYTEYWGKFVEGVAHGESEKCFNSFFKKLGTCYEELLKKPELFKNGKNQVYGDVRCGLAHAYMIEGNAFINLGTGRCGVEYDVNTKTYTFNVITYFEDFKRAVDKYISGLETGEEDFTAFECAIAGKPTLI